MLTSLRRLWRASRSAPGLGAVLAQLDRLWWMRTISRAHVVDLDFVKIQLGRPVSMAAAIRAYVNGGFRTGLSLNPLFLEDHVSAQLPDSARVPAMYAYLVADGSKISTTVAWDAVAFATARPESVKAPGGPLGVAWRELTQGSPLTWGPLEQPQRATHDELLQDAVSALQSHSWRVPDPPVDTVILWSVSDADSDGLDVHTAISTASAIDAVVVFEVRDAPASVRIVCSQLALAHERVTVSDTPLSAQNAPDFLPDETLLVSRAPGATITEPDLLSMIQRARSLPIGALWLAGDGTVASAGIVAHKGRGYPLFTGHPPEDLRHLGGTLSVARADSPIVAKKVGARPALATLLTISTISPTTPGELTLAEARDTRLDEITPGRGLKVHGWGPHGPLIRRITEELTLNDGTSVPRLRWAIKTAAPAGPRGESWGDTHFARGLAAALERLGQYVAVDARSAAHRSTAALDDVNLVLRGPALIEPPKTGTSVLWVISHPDEISSGELSSFSLRYAASEIWARKASDHFNCEVAPLAQCTDATRFTPRGSHRTADLVFVGTARGIARPSVLEPLRAGAPLRVYGPDWRGYIPASAITATHVPNEELPALYETAGAVMNDHWPAMQKEGFISNRLYDVVAAGGRAISDNVVGIAETFGGAVRTYDSAAELREIVKAPLDTLFEDDQELKEIARKIRREHSFDARARTLLEDVLVSRAE